MKLCVPHWTQRNEQGCEMNKGWSTFFPTESYFNDFRQRREMTRHTPRGPARCEDCGAELDYDCGSIAWSVRRKDQCASCAGKEAGKEASRVFRESLGMPSVNGTAK